MKKSLRSLCAITTISLCAMGNLFAVDNNYFNSVYMIDQKQSLVQEWDKVFPQSDKVHHMKVTFRNRYGIILLLICISLAMLKESCLLLL